MIHAPPRFLYGFCRPLQVVARVLAKRLLSGILPRINLPLPLIPTPLLQGVDTGAGMVVFDPPVTVATVQDVDTHDDDLPQVCG